MIEPREQAVQVLYAADTRNRRVLDDEFDVAGRAGRLVNGVLDHLEELDRAIESVSDHWHVDRMPVVDRAVLRLGLYELRYEPDTPTAVILSEAVRIAKLYSTDRSGAFVNGVLAGLAERERR